MKSSKLHAVLAVPVVVTDAQCLSGGIVYGFPAMTSFLGLENALARKIHSPFFNFDGVTVCVHSHTIKAERIGMDLYPRQIRKSPDTPKTLHSMLTSGMGIIESCLMNLDITLLFRISEKDSEEGIPSIEIDAFADEVVSEIFTSSRVAGGAISKSSKKHSTWIFPGDEEDALVFNSLKRSLLPGFLPFDRTNVLGEHLKGLRELDEEADILDALLDLCGMFSEEESVVSDKKDASSPPKPRRYSKKLKTGWFVPASLGFVSLTGILPAGSVSGARDMTAKVSFAEPCYSMLEFISAHRLSSLTSMFWKPSIEKIEDKVFFLAKNM